MPTTFNVVSLGINADMDTTEGNTTAENAAALVGLTFGTATDPLLNNFSELSPGSVPFGSDGNTFYDMNDPTPETFSIDGGPDQGFDGTSVYGATITYTDGTTATISAVIFQDTAGNTYWAPEFSSNADQAALEAAPIQSLSLDTLLGNQFSGMTGSRETWDFVTCFAKDSRIATPRGMVPVQQLKKGDLVITQDHGLQPIRWIGKSKKRVTPNIAPICFEPGSLGKNLPVRELRVSPQHRMVLRSKIARRVTGEDEIFVAAKKLVGLPGVRVDDSAARVTYFHILFDSHEVIYSENAPSESLYLGENAIEAMDPALLSELQTIFPDLMREAMASARLIPSHKKQNMVIERLVKNERPVYEFVA